MSAFGVFLVRIFKHLDWIHRDTEYLSVFSPNWGKIRARKTPNTDTFYSIMIPGNIQNLILIFTWCLHHLIMLWDNVLYLLLDRDYKNWSAKLQDYLHLGGNKQEQPPEVFYKNSCSYKFLNIHRKTSLLESLFNKLFQKRL